MCSWYVHCIIYIILYLGLDSLLESKRVHQNAMTRSESNVGLELAIYLFVGGTSGDYQKQYVFCESEPLKSVALSMAPDSKEHENTNKDHNTPIRAYVLVFGG